MPSPTLTLTPTPTPVPTAMTKKTIFHVVNDTFIEPGSANGTNGVYQPHKSKIFRPNETIELYTELVGMSQKRIINETTNNIQYLTIVSATLNITDRQENVEVTSTYRKRFSPFGTESIDAPLSHNDNVSYVFGFNPASPPLDPENYTMNFTITDNLSGETAVVTKDIIISNGVTVNGNKTSVILPSENSTKGQVENKSLLPLLNNNSFTASASVNKFR